MALSTNIVSGQAGHAALHNEERTAINATLDVESSTTTQGIHRNTNSPTYGKWFSVGNAGNSAGFSGTGSPAEAFGALVVYQNYGVNNGANAPVTKTTQGAYLLTNYFGPTTDDSAEAFSTFVGIKGTGTAFNQAKPITSFEAIAQLESPNTANVGDSAPLLGIGARTNVLGTASAATVIGVKVSHNSSGGPSYGTTTKYIGFFQPAASGATTPYGVYTIDPINSESALSVGRSAGTALKVLYGGGSDGSTSLAILGQPVATYGSLSGTYTLSTTPQTLTTNSGATLPAGGGTFMLDTTARTMVTYTAFSGTSISGATIASGTVSTSSGLVLVDPAAPNTTALRINAQPGQSKNISEWWDSTSNLRLRINANGNLVTQGTDIFTGSSTTTMARISGSAGYVQPGTSSGTGAKIYSGSGVPGIVSGSAAGDFFFRDDTPSTANQRLYVATAPNTWTAIL